MQAVPVETLESSALPSTFTRAKALDVASKYVTANIDPALKVIAGDHHLDKPSETGRWRFFVCSAHAPLRAIHVDTKTGRVTPFTSDEIRVVREHAAIAEAKSKGVLPLNEDGYVLSEYARRRANGYLTMQISMHYSVNGGLFIPLERPIWQFAIKLQLPRVGILGIMGTIDVDAEIGEPIPLDDLQVKKIRERSNAIVKLRTQTAET
ncbi:hypothetical protein KFU94_49875 [Chloroflexi bacterium TSY]|nr:hypothetical protein [Chloroflexi bacterium TSY]